MDTNDMEIERSLTEYKERHTKAELRINSLLPEYGITPPNDGTDPRIIVVDQIIRLSILRLITSEQQGTTDDELHAVKQDTIVNLVASSHLKADSAWIDLINDIVIPERPVIFDDDLITTIKEERSRAAATQQSVQEDIQSYFNSLTPEQQQELGFSEE